MSSIGKYVLSMAAFDDNKFIINAKKLQNNTYIISQKKVKGRIDQTNMDKG